MDAPLQGVPGFGADTCMGGDCGGDYAGELGGDYGIGAGAGAGIMAGGKGRGRGDAKPRNEGDWPYPSPRSAVKKADTMFSPRTLVDTRVPDIYPSVKPGERLRFFPLRSQKDKDVPSVTQNEAIHTQVPAKGRLDAISLFARYKSNPVPLSSAKVGVQFPGGQDDVVAKVEEKPRGLHSCSFRDVRDLSDSQALLKSESSIDMMEALKKFAPRKALGPFDLNMGLHLPTNGYNSAKQVAQASENGTIMASNVHNRTSPPTSVPAEASQAWVPMEGSTAPLDLSLKMLARFNSQDSLHWCHRLSSNTQCEGVRQFTETTVAVMKESNRVDSLVGCGDSEKRGAMFWQSLHSWVHPQAILPPTMLTAISTAAARGGEAESTFLSKRCRAWEDAFRSLYYTFCSRKCSLFYFCAQQFVAMFVGGGVGGRNQDACTAYMTRSTRGVRHLLGEQDIKFSMPFGDKEEATTTLEDLRDLSEFEKSNPGQTRLVDERAASDNSPRSLLCFEGTSNVHRLYDFLLNHRSLLNYTAANDVPVLYAPAAFDNASLIVPEVTCKQMQRTEGTTKPVLQDCGAKKSSISKSAEAPEAPRDMTYTMEIRGSILPPWVITRLCSVLQKSQQPGFTVRFQTEPLSEGLNIAQEVTHPDGCKVTNFKKFFSELNGTTNSSLSLNPIQEPKASSNAPTSEFSQPSRLGSAVVKELKCEGGTYMAVMSPLQLSTSY